MESEDSISAPDLEKSEPSEKLGGDEEKLTKSEITMPSLYPEHNISIPKYCEPEGNKDENKENESKIDKENILEADNNAETLKESEKCTETSVEKSSENLSKDIKCTEAPKNIDLLKETEKNKEVLLEVEMSDISGEDVEDITEVAKDSEMLVDDSKDVETDIKVIKDVNVPKKFDENSNDIMEVDEEKEVLLTVLDNTEALVDTLNKLEVSTKMNAAEVDADVNKVEVLVDVNEAKAPIDVNEAEILLDVKEAETSAVMDKAETHVNVVLTNVKSAEISFNVNNTEVSTNAIDTEVPDSMKNAESPKNVMNNPEIPADVNKTEVSVCATNNVKLQDFVNCEEVPGSAYDNLDLPVEMKIDKEGAIAKLIINGYEGPDEDYKVMTLQEVGDFLKKETLRYMRDPSVNPLIQVQKRIDSLVEQIEAKTAEMKELTNSVEKINEDQVKFLRHMGAMPKIKTKDASVHIDLEWLPEELENMCEKNAKRNIPKKSSKRNRPKTPPNVELIDLTDDVDRSEPPELKNVKPTIETKHTTVELPKVKTEKINYITNLTTIPYAPGLLVTALPSPLLVSTSACILNNNDIPPKPLLKIYVDKNGILLQWDMPPEAKKMKITGYEIFVAQEKPDMIINNSVWKKIGTVDAMPLPMSCTLTQFVEGFKYNFCIRAMANDKCGPFSDPSTVVFIVKK